MSRRGDVLTQALADYEIRSRRPILESLAPMSMESAALASREAAVPPPVSTPRKRHNRVANAFWAGAAGAMSVIALGLVVRIGTTPVASASAALPATPQTSQTTAPATLAMATEGVPFAARKTVMLEPVMISGNDAPAAEARTPTAAPVRAAAPAPTVAMAASLAAASPRTPSAQAPSGENGGSVEISRSAAAVAISTAGRRAASCLQPGDARGSMPVSVTFAPSGRVTTSTVDGGPFAGTTTGGCIARALRSAGVAPFNGAPVTVHSSVSFR